MSVITYDGQSFTIDGRRIWLAGGTVEYARCPRDQWPERLASARAAGLNCITTSVVWSRHEARPGQFDFTGDADLRHFVELVGKAGMYAVLRIGPFVGTGLDMGGLPAWLLTLNNGALRTNNAPFLEACSRFISAVARQVKDLQATSVIGPGGEAKPGGPIILVQNESGWTCGHDAIAHGYLGELHRYIRESGFDVPLVNANDLWQGVEGEIDGWTGAGSMLRNLRQLGAVRPSQPRLVVEYHMGRQSAWGDAPEPSDDRAHADALERGLAEMLAAGAQFNVEPFCAGTNFGFSAGRLDRSPASFSTTSADRGAVVDDGGKKRAGYRALRRVAMFASRFGRLLSHLDTKRPSVSLMPPDVVETLATEEEKAGRKRSAAGAGACSLVHLTGTQGSVAFLFAPPRRGGAVTVEPMTLLLPDGTLLPVHLGEQPVAWCLIDTRLVGRSQLDYCNLSAIAIAGRVFVCAGPVGAPARLSINGADVEAEVPAGDEPLLLDHEGVLVCIVNDAALDHLHIADDAVYMGVDGLSLEGQPIVAAWGTKFTKISGSGLQTVVAEQHPKRPVPPAPKVDARGSSAPKGKAKPKGKDKKGKHAEAVAEPEPPPLPPTAEVVPRTKPAGKVTLSPWGAATLDDYLDGTCPRFASIAGPADLNVLGAPYGYGWYRLTLKNGSSRKLHVGAPHMGDRLMLFTENHASGPLGVGPGADPEAVIHLSRGEQTLVVLAENFGRFSGGPNLGEGKGLFGHLWEVAAIKAGKPTVKHAEPFNVLAFRAPLPKLHEGDVTESARLCWTLHHKRKTPVLLTLAPGQHRGVVFVNDKPVKFFDQSGPATVWLDEAALSRGNVDVQLAVLGDPDLAALELQNAVGFYECVENLTAKAEWAFAKWEPPSAGAFSLEHRRSHVAHGPRWWRATFPCVSSRGGFRLETEGLSKGQAYVNGRHLGRYFTATFSGKHVGPQTGLYVPPSFVHPAGSGGRDNEVLIFDEHGFNPSKVRLTGE
jgi:beta-galactosidase